MVFLSEMRRKSKNQVKSKFDFDSDFFFKQLIASSHNLLDELFYPDLLPTLKYALIKYIFSFKPLIK